MPQSGIELEEKEILAGKYIAAEIINESNGALCGGTPSEIAEAIRQVLGNKYNQTEIRRLATEKFAPENVARQYFTLYNEILKS